MSEPAEHVLRMARSRALDRLTEEEIARYQRMAELFRRLTRLDEHSLGPELAKLQNIGTTCPPRGFGFRNRLRSLFLAAVTPLLGRLLKAASLASPYQAAYELAVHMHEQQLQVESQVCTEVSALVSRIDELESEIHSRRRTA